MRSGRTPEIDRLIYRNRSVDTFLTGPSAGVRGTSVICFCGARVEVRRVVEGTGSSNSSSIDLPAF